MRRGLFWTSAMLARAIVRLGKKGSMAVDPQASSRADSVLQPITDDIASTTSSLLYSLALLYGTDMLFSCAPAAAERGRDDVTTLQRQARRLDSETACP
jgi:hypothetical protein